MTSSIFVYNKDIYLSIYDWSYIHWLLLTVDLWNEIIEMEKWNEVGNWIVMCVAGLLQLRIKSICGLCYVQRVCYMFSCQRITN